MGGTTCLALPDQTSGRFPADGTDVREGQLANILTEDGVIREDIRTPIAGLQPVAGGVPVTLQVTLQDVRKGCAGLAGHVG